ncbi:hypothetical protein ACSSS7_003244 [Eimeria intestinalis]
MTAWWSVSTNTLTQIAAQLESLLPQEDQPRIPPQKEGYRPPAQRQSSLRPPDQQPVGGPYPADVHLSASSVQLPHQSQQSGPPVWEQLGGPARQPPAPATQSKTQQLGEEHQRNPVEWVAKVRDLLEKTQATALDCLSLVPSVPPVLRCGVASVAAALQIATKCSKRIAACQRRRWERHFASCLQGS